MGDGAEEGDVEEEKGEGVWRGKECQDTPQGGEALTKTKGLLPLST